MRTIQHQWILINGLNRCHPSRPAAYRLHGICYPTLFLLLRASISWRPTLRCRPTVAVEAVVAADHSNMVLQAEVKRVAAPVAEEAMKEENIAESSVLDVGVVAHSYVRGFLSEEPQYFEKAYFHWDDADSKCYRS